MAAHWTGALLSAVTLTFVAPARAQTAAGEEGGSELRLALEIGVRQRDGAAVDRLRAVRARAFTLLAERGAQLPDAVEDLAASVLAADTLPVTLRFYLPSDWHAGVSRQPPGFVAVIDAQGKLALPPMAAPGGGRSRLFVEERRLRSGGCRYLVGAGRETLGAGLAAVARQPAPFPAEAQRLFSRVAAAPVYAHLDLSQTLAPADLEQLHGVAGPSSHLLALGLTRIASDWDLEIHWGVEPGQGRLGALLPRDVEPTRLDELLPWQPGLALQGNLGESFGSRALPLLERTRSPLPGIFAMILQTGREEWTGEFGIYQPAGASGAPANEFAFLLRSSDKGAAALVEAMRGNIRRGLVPGHEEGTWRLDAADGQSLAFGQRAGVVVVCGGRDGEAAARTLSGCLAAATQPRGERRASGAKLAGALQVWMTAEAFAAAGARLEDRRARALGRWLPQGQASAIVRLLREAESGIGLAVECDGDGLRLRCRF